MSSSRSSHAPRRRTVAVIAPANSMADLSQELRRIGERHLEQLGFQVRYGAHVDKRHLHMAGTVSQRVEDFMAAVEDESVDIILPVFGGYNSNQLLDHLDFERLARTRKVLVGFSDVTALLVPLSRLPGWLTVHGPSFSVLCDPGLFDYTRAGFARVVAGETVTFESPDFTAEDVWYLKPGYGPREAKPFKGWQVYREGHAEGPLMGGNLETLGALAGTRYFPELRGRLLFLEDAFGTHPAPFHRDLTRLGQMGAYEQIAGLILGKVPEGTTLASAETMRAILQDVLPARASFPVVYEVHCAHVDPMVSLPLERRGRLEASRQQVKLTVHC